MIPLPNLMRLPAVPFFFFPPAAKEVAISTAWQNNFWIIIVFLAHPLKLAVIGINTNVKHELDGGPFFKKIFSALIVKNKKLKLLLYLMQNNKIFEIFWQ